MIKIHQERRNRGTEVANVKSKGWEYNGAIVCLRVCVCVCVCVRVCVCVYEEAECFVFEPQTRPARLAHCAITSLTTWLSHFKA